MCLAEHEAQIMITVRFCWWYLDVCLIPHLWRCSQPVCPTFRQVFFVIGDKLIHSPIGMVSFPL